MILNKHDLEDDWNAVNDEPEPAPVNHCDWCGEPVAEFDRFCPATDCQAAYFECCEIDGDPAEHREINKLYRDRGWA